MDVELPEYTLDEVALHTKPNDLWCATPPSAPTKRGDSSTLPTMDALTRRTDLPRETHGGRVCE